MLGLGWGMCFGGTRNFANIPHPNPAPKGEGLMSGVRFSPRRVAALVRKETMQILRDPSTFLIAFVLPMIMLFLFGFAVSLDTTRTRVGVVLQDSSAPALRLAQAYANSAYFDVTLGRSVAELRPSMTNEKLRALFVIPQDFGAQVKRG